MAKKKKSNGLVKRIVLVIILIAMLAVTILGSL